jgi:DNA replication protein DnaC
MMPGEAASHLFQVISRRYEHGSIVLTTNRSIGRLGGHIFEDTTVATAVLNRLLHHAGVVSVTGDSYRMRRPPTSDQRAPTRPHRAPPGRGTPMIT